MLRNTRIQLYKKNLILKQKLHRFFNIPLYVWIRNLGAVDITKVYYVSTINDKNQVFDSGVQCCLVIGGANITLSANNRDGNVSVKAAQRHILRYF